MLKLVIDDREQAVIPHFTMDSEIMNITIERLQIGDYAFYIDDELLFIIERKSWKDLAASIRDGRKDNIEKLLIAREKSGCKIIYLIEGKARHSPTKKFSRIEYKNLQAHLDHIIIRDDIFIIYSDSISDTPLRLIEFGKNWLTLNLRKNKKTEGGVINMLKTPIEKTAERKLNELWTTIPYINEKTANVFIENKYTLTNLLLGEISKEDIANLKYGSGIYLGEKRAEKIHKISELTNPENFKVYCNILSSVRGINKKTASLLLVKFGIENLLKKSININELAEFKKTSKSKLGKKAAERLLGVF